MSTLVMLLSWQAKSRSDQMSWQTQGFANNMFHMMVLQSKFSGHFHIEQKHYSRTRTARDAQQYTQQDTPGQITCDDLFKYHMCTDHFVLSNETRWTHNFSLYNTEIYQLQQSTLNLTPRQTDRQTDRQTESLHTHTRWHTHWQTLAHTHTHTHTHTHKTKTDRQTDWQADRKMQVYHSI